MVTRKGALSDTESMDMRVKTLCRTQEADEMLSRAVIALNTKTTLAEDSLLALVVR